MAGTYERVHKVVVDNWRDVVLGIASVAAFLFIWQVYAGYLHGTWLFHGAKSGIREFVPYPGAVVAAFLDSFVHRDPATQLLMGTHIISSLKRIFLGFVVAFVLAVPIGLLMGRMRGAAAVGRPIVELFRPIPPLAWIPLFLLLFGIAWGPIGIVYLGIFFPILLNVIFGARSVDPVLIDAARTLGARSRDIFVKVVLPSTLPYLMTGIKVGLGIGWMCIVAAEMLGSVGGGVGYYIFAMPPIGRFDLMYAGMLVVGLLSVLTTGVAGVFERWVYRWMGKK